jgi:hypothetical protein
MALMGESEFEVPPLSRLIPRETGDFEPRSCRIGTGTGRSFAAAMDGSKTFSTSECESFLDVLDLEIELLLLSVIAVQTTISI